MDRPFIPVLQVAPIALERQAEALALCWPELSEGQRLRQFAQVSAGSVDSVLLGAWRGGQLVGVVRFQIQAGRTATLAPPRLNMRETPETAIQLVREACAVCRAAGCLALHVLMPPAAADDARVLTRAGLRHVADLLLMMSLPVDFPDKRPPLDLEFHDVGQIGDERLEALIQRTYAGSLDFPQIEGCRTMKDVLAGYRASGPFVPERWVVASRRREDVGCIIITADANAAQWELTYLGVVPEARGQGLGAQLVRHAQWMTNRADRERLVVAVDAQNTPALRVYDKCGFIEWNRQSVFWSAL
jgi:ribosomal protein S18 acetylase RimI-like enzyme